MFFALLFPFCDYFTFSLINAFFFFFFGKSSGSIIFTISDIINFLRDLVTKNQKTCGTYINNDYTIGDIELKTKH